MQNLQRMKIFDMKNILRMSACTVLFCASQAYACGGLEELRLASQQYEGVYHDTIAVRDITYKVADNQVLQLDIAYPKTSAPKGGYPLIVYYHGGAWSGGKRFEGYGFFNDEIRHYNEKGLAVASVTYRFVNDVRTIADCVIDSKDAIRFVVKNHEALKINPDKIGVYGHSAGGHLAMMVALADNEKFLGDVALKDVKFKIACGVPQSGPTSFTEAEANFEDASRRDFPKHFFGRYDSDDAEIKRISALVSPANYVSKNSPPLLIIIGENDHIVTPKSAVFMRSLAKKTGAPFEIFIAPKAGHSFEHGDHVEILKKRRAFIEKYLLEK